MKIHELLMRGGDIETECISSDRKLLKTFTCQRSEEFYFFDSKDLSSATLRTGPYHIPRAANYVSIESFYYPLEDDNLKEILLFQMNASRINENDIVALLEVIGLMDEALAHPETVALIFFGAADSAPEIKRQQCALDLEAFEMHQEQTKQMLVRMPQYVWKV